MIELLKNRLILTLLLGFFLFPNTYLYAAEPKSDAIPSAKIEQFVEVFKRVKEQYVEDIDDAVLFDYAIRGMVSSLDPHSSFLSKDDFNELKIGTTGRFGGLGIEITMEEGFVKIISPIDDTPASRAGLISGDFITKIDDTLVKGLTIGEAVKLMRGEPGTSVTITVIREGERQPLVINLIREIIVAKGVKTELLEGNIGYIRLSSFQSKSTDHINSHVINLNFFEQSIIGLIGTGFVALLLNFFFPLNDLIIYLNLFIGLIFIFFFKDRIKFNYNKSSRLFIILFFF